MKELSIALENLQSTVRYEFTSLEIDMAVEMHNRSNRMNMMFQCNMLNKKNTQSTAIALMEDTSKGIDISTRKTDIYARIPSHK